MDSVAERRDMGCVQLLRQRNSKVLARQHILGIPAVDRVSGEGGMVAEVLHFMLAEKAVAVGAAHPGDAHTRAHRQSCAVARNDLSHNLMAQYQVFAQRGQVSLGDVQVSPAHATCKHTQQHLSGLDLWARNVSNPQMDS
jgi:hypothetical protein